MKNTQNTEPIISTTTILLSTFKPLKLYKNRSFSLDSPYKKVPRKGVMVTMLTDSKDAMKSFFNTGLIASVYLKGIFTDKYVRMTLFSLPKKFKQKVTVIYKNYKKEMPYLTLSFLAINQYGGRNIIYDATEKFKFLTIHPPCSKAVYLQNCYTLLDSIILDPQFKVYPKKYVILCLDDSFKVDKMAFAKPNIKHINQVMVYRLLYDAASLTAWLGVTLIFTNNKKMFTYYTITEEDISTKGVPTYESKLIQYLRLLWAYEVQDTETIIEGESLFEKHEVPQCIGNLSSSLLHAPTFAASLHDSNAAETPIIIDTSKDDEEDDDLETITHNLDKTVTGTLSDGTEYTDDTTVTDITEVILKDDTEEPDADTDEDEDEEKPKEEEELEKVETYKKATNALITSAISVKTPEVTRRIKLLGTKFEKSFFAGTKKSHNFKEMLTDFEDTTVPREPLPASHISDPSIQYATGQLVSKAYYEKQLEPTMVAIFNMFANNQDLKMFVTKAEKLDISTPLNSMYQYRFTLEDENGVKHRIDYNIPKLVDNKFFLVNGSKKMLEGQIIHIPIIKLGPNDVRITTAHNKIDISRFGKAFDAKLEALKKYIAKFKGNGSYGVTYKLGDSSLANSKYTTTLEYDELAKSFYTISIASSDKKRSISFIFNQKDIRAMMEELHIAYVEKPHLIPISITHDKTVGFIDSNTGKDHIVKDASISDLILTALRQYSTFSDIEKTINSYKTSKRYMYARMLYLDEHLAVGVFLAFLYGFSTLLKDMNVSYSIHTIMETYHADTKKEGYNHILFKDGYILYTIYPLRHSLILNGIKMEVDCEAYTIAQMDEERPYLDTFEALFRTTQMAKGYKICKAWMMDPISVKVLKQLGLPYILFDVMLYAVSLLEDNTCTDPKHTALNRVRKYEIIPWLMYRSLVKTYMSYTHRYSKRGKFQVKPNDVLMMLDESRRFLDYDTLNPIRELETENSISYKGPGGFNTDDAYSLSARAYDKSMVGIYGASTPEGSSVGITKFLTLNPRISNTLGFMKTGDADDVHEIGFGNMGSVAELLVPGTIDHDDPKRLGMVSKESKHVIAAKDTDPLLIRNGVERVVPYMISNDFITIAKDDGRVLSVNKELGVAIVKYRNGTTEAIDIVDREQKNGGMGVFVVCAKEFTFKEGETFKKHEALAINPSYFSTETSRRAPEFNPGVLANVAIIMSSTTFEDSSMITERIAKRLSTDIVYPKSFTIGAKANVQQFVTIGQQVKVGEPLMIFEDETDDADIAAIVGAADLSNIEHLDEIVRKVPTSKISGIIHNIRIFYTVPLSEMSESVRKIVQTHDKRIRDKQKHVEMYKAAFSSDIVFETIGVTKPTSLGKINGVHCPVGRILIEIYTKTTDVPSSGDKIVFYAAMKTVIHRQLPQELAPYPLGRKDTPIDAVLNPISIEARMVMSIFHAMYGNKCVIALKDAVQKLYNKYSKSSDTVKEEADRIENLDELALEDALNVIRNSVTVTYEETKETMRNIYLALSCMVGPVSPRALFVGAIKKFTDSSYNHASIAYDSSGVFYSLSVKDISDLIFKKDGGSLYAENFNTYAFLNKGVPITYDVYKITVSRMDHERLISLMSKQKKNSFIYNFGDVIKIGFRLLKDRLGGNPITDFSSSELWSSSMVCSAYCLSMLCLSIPSFLQHVSEHNISIKQISPAALVTLPGIELLFSATGDKPFTSWKKDYEKEHGKLIN